MKKNIITVLSMGFLAAGGLHANDETAPAAELSTSATEAQKADAVINIKEKQTLKDVEDFVSTLNPQETIVILDVDGTLTNRSQPRSSDTDDDEEEATVKRHSAEPRGNAVNFVKSLVDQGYGVVASSAWDQIADTLGRLNNLGLGETLKIGTPSCETLTSHERAVKVCRTGLVVSVQDSTIDRYYFRQKALSPFFVDGLEAHLKSVKNVVFADDSGGNIKNFSDDVKLSHLYQGATVTLFSLTSARGEPDLQ